jgi:2-methylcitrate dehydratase PrpD
MSDEHPITERLAAFVADLRYDDLPEAAVDRLKQCLLDFVGISAFAGAEAESSEPFRRAVQSLALPGGRTTVVGEPRGYASEHAALLNGAFAHTLDFDDTNLFASLHPGAPVIAAALPLAELANVSGRVFLEALAAGYEVSCRIGAALGQTAYDRGFHITAVAGVFGAVAAGAKIGGFTAAQTANAFGLAGSQAAGSMQYLDNGSWNKRLHPGLAAHNALIALALTRAGVLGATGAIEGRYGLLAGYSNAPRPDLALLDLGRRWVLAETAIKPYPSCRFTHGAIDAVLALREKVDAADREGAALAIRLSPKAVQIVGEPLPGKMRPANIVEGQFSVYFQAAVAWLDGRVDWASYTRLGDPAVEALTGRMTVASDPAVAMAGAEVTVAVNGATTQARVEQPLGEPECPVPWPRLEQKFESLARDVLGADRLPRIVAGVRRLDTVPRVAQWIRLLRGRGRA